MFQNLFNKLKGKKQNKFSFLDATLTKDSVDTVIGTDLQDGKIFCVPEEYDVEAMQLFCLLGEKYENIKMGELKAIVIKSLSYVTFLINNKNHYPYDFIGDKEAELLKEITTKTKINGEVYNPEEIQRILELMIFWTNFVDLLSMQKKFREVAMGNTTVAELKEKMKLEGF